MPQSIKNKLFSGIAYTAIAKYSGIMISLIITSILARLISPDDFGIIAIATVIITFFNLFTDIGISPAIIQNKNLDKSDLSNIFTFTFWMGIALSFLFFFLAWPIAAYYDKTILKNICQLLCINIFFVSLNIVPNALFYKNREFKFIALRSLIIQLICGLIAIITAYLGAQLYALTINPILSVIFIFIVSIKRYPLQFKLFFNIKSINKIFHYSLYQFLFNIINFFSRNIDKLVIGKHLGMVALGYYEKSYRLMMLPLQNITHVITPVMHPILSEFQNDTTQLVQSYEKIIKILAFIGLPLSILLFFTSDEAILIIFGNQWIDSIPIFKILSLSIGIQIILSSSGSIFQASNDTKSLFICGVFSSILNIVGILLGIFHWKSLDAVAWCILVTFTINFFQCYVWMYKFTLNRPFKNFIKILISPFILTIIILIILIPLSYCINGLNILLTALSKFITTILICIAYLQISKEYDFICKLKAYIHSKHMHNKSN